MILYTYGKEPKGSHWQDTASPAELDYWYFTKYNSDVFPRIDFDGATFTCYVVSTDEFKRLQDLKRIHEVYDTYGGKVYAVRHRIGTAK